jgi:hypothetical protein
MKGNGQVAKAAVKAAATNGHPSDVEASDNPAVSVAPVAQINIQRIAASSIRVPVVGTAPLIVHNWSKKAKQQMLDAQQGKRKVKEVRDPEADYNASFYRLGVPEPGQRQKYGFPVLGFKAATISAARFYGKDVTMTMLKQCLFFRGIMTAADNQQLVEIDYEWDEEAMGGLPLDDPHRNPHMREDVVRLGQGSTDLRYRAEFFPWRAELIVTYVESALSQDSVLSLIDSGGMGVGVGEWRPQRGGQYGTYEIDESRPVRPFVPGEGE